MIAAQTMHNNSFDSETIAERKVGVLGKDVQKQIAQVIYLSVAQVA